MRIVLVHGGWQGGWAWDGVVAELTKAGHEVWAPTLQGHGDNDDRAGVTLSTMADNLIGRIADKGWDRFVVVGHSGGGPQLCYSEHFIEPSVTESLGERLCATWPVAALSLAV